MDEASNAMLTELVNSIEGTKTLAIVNYRPEYSPAWGGEPPTARSRSSRSAKRTRASCCATWPARTPRSTGSRS